MRVIPVSALALLAGVATAWAQPSPPLAPYVPPPSASPLAPPPTTAPAAPENLGEVRLKSDKAANISAADTRSIIAPQLPAPQVSEETPKAYLMAAQSALASGQTGAAQAALENAETLVLTRSVPHGAGGDPSHSPVVEAISSARQALSVGSTDDAKADIATALAKLQ